MTSAAPGPNDTWFADGDAAPRRYECIHLSAGRPGDYSLAFFRTLGATIRSLDATRRFDVIHAQEFAGMFLPGFDGRLVATVHGTLFTETELDRRYQGHDTMADLLRDVWKFKHRLALAPFFAPALRRCAAVAVDSEFTAGELAETIPGLDPAPRVIPLGIDWTRYAEPDPADRRRGGPTRLPIHILCLGRVQRRKGVFAAVAAIDALVNRLGLRDIKLAVCGHGEDLAELRALVEERGLADHVQCPGGVNRKDLAFSMANANVFLFPDLTQPAFGLVALEAMRHGSPVIGARSGAIPEVVDLSAGWLYDPWDERELVKLLHALIRDPSQIDIKAAAAPGLASKFNVGRMAEAYESFYVTALANR